MQIDGELRVFSEDDIAHAPEEPGVYALYQGDRLIYIGRAEGGLAITTIRAHLKNHQAGRFGPLASQATHYRCEVHPHPVAREHELLAEYEARYGEPPPCNPVFHLPRKGRHYRY